MDTHSIQIVDYLKTQSWQIAVLVLIIAAVTLVLKNKSAHIRYLLWLIVLAKCLMPPLFEVPVALLPAEQTSQPLSLVPQHTPLIGPEVAESPVTRDSAPLDPLVSGISAPAMSKTNPQPGFRQWLALGWIVGLIVFVLTAVIKALRTELWLRRKRKPLPGGLKAETRYLFSSLGVKISPKLWLVEDIGQPFVWGLLRGGIYLPASFVKNNSAEHRRGILGHELSHILRLDATINLLQIAAQAIFWFHPFVWWANRRIRAEREKCCDEMAIARLGANAKDYSDAIVNVLISEHGSTRPVPSLAVAGPVKNIEERITIMLKPGKKFYKHPSLPAAVMIVLLSLVAVPTTMVLTVKAASQQPTDAAGADRVFGNPTNIGSPVNSFANEYGPEISADELELYFISNRAGGLGQIDIWVTTRKTKMDSWGDPVNLGPIVNSPANDGPPCISADGLTLYFSSDRPGGHGGRDLWMTTRKTKTAPWGKPVNIGPVVNSEVDEQAPSISSDGLELYFSSHSQHPESVRPGGSGGSDLWVTARKTSRDAWDVPENLGPTVNSSFADANPSISGDGLSLYFNSDRPGGSGVGDLWVTKRESKSDPWGTPVNVGPAVNTSDWDIDPDISRDGSTLYFSSRRSIGVGGFDTWQAKLEQHSEETPESKAQTELAASLKEAVEVGDSEQVRLLLSKGAGVNAKDKEGKTPLHWAAYYGRREAAQVLIGEGANINEVDASGQTPLHIAAKFGTKFVPELLLANRANISARDIAGNTPLHSAAGNADVSPDLLELLIAKGADVKATNAAGQTPLHSVSMIRTQNKRLELTAEVLLAHGAEVNAKDKSGNTPLHFAAENGYRKLIDLLLDKGTDIEAKAADGATPLHRSVTRKRSDVVELLLDRGADVNAKTVSGETPAQLAASWNRKDTVKLLVSKGAEVSTIQLAAYVGDLAKVKSFVEKGVSVSAPEEYWPALHAAASSGQRAVVEYLINKGVSVNAPPSARDGETPLYLAAYGGSTEVAELLLSKGAEIEAPDTLGFTALHGAAMVGDANMVSLLIAHGADLNAKTHYDKTPLYYAAWSDSDEVIKLLIEKGAMISNDDGCLTGACLRGHKNLAELLVKKGANVNFTTWGDSLTLETVWSEISSAKKLGILRLLLDHGADPNAKDRYDWSLLHYTYKDVDLAKLLLDKGANPNGIETERGLTPLHLAADKGLKEPVELLISRGADVNVKDYNGRTPLSYATDLGDNDMYGRPRSTPLTTEAKSAKKEVAELLRKHGATE